MEELWQYKMIMEMDGGYFIGFRFFSKVLENIKNFFKCIRDEVGGLGFQELEIFVGFGVQDRRQKGKENLIVYL